MRTVSRAPSAGRREDDADTEIVRGESQHDEAPGRQHQPCLERARRRLLDSGWQIEPRE
ncbi:hypothetical protein HFP15_24355 [Amycolatopsis sp. K13G38]|uniref:Uncharacterized protein n=1 Tax=Amycolatopsis acididurans TaxID=2724524 RepID=A0ABX1J899_9PSEU|nr:hypothetical protein [Amycolatopsis acididurans]NKQ56016.1 hypothetical protein [Amycolatopsis acididurans]